MISAEAWGRLYSVLMSSKTGRPRRGGEAAAAAKDVQAGYIITRLHHALRRELDDRLREFGLNTAHYLLLRELSGGEALSAADLARRAYVRPQAMAPIITTLETRGLIKRSPHRQHRRILEVRLTPAGLKMLAACAQRCDKVEEQLLAGLNPAERTRLLRVLQDCLANMDPPWYEREDSAPPVRRVAAAGTSSVRARKTRANGKHPA